MNDRVHTGLSLMQDMEMSGASIDRRRKMVGLEPADAERIASVADLIREHADDYTNAFFNHLATLEEGRKLISNRPVLNKLRELKNEHLRAMVGGEYGLSYVEQRVELAALYASQELDTRAFLGAFHHLLRSIGEDIMKQAKGTPLEAFEAFMSFNKVAFFDIGVIVDVLAFERERLIRQQQEAIRELSTPVLQLRERLLLLPIIGLIDTHRARVITENLLRSIRSNRAKVVVMDVTGVLTIDSKVANHILQTVTAARLMGSRIIVTGLSSDVAQALAATGIELSKLTTVGDLQGGLEEAEQMMGYRIVQMEKPDTSADGER
jgi:rsbT co-antagonist protein RsbR